MYLPPLSDSSSSGSGSTIPLTSSVFDSSSIFNYSPGAIGSSSSTFF
jgi:hypothetical protein